MAFLTLDRVALTTPDGSPLFQDLSFSLGAERVGLVGRNGSGKSSLLAAIAQGRAPVEGSIKRTGKIAMLDQLPPDDAMPVPQALGMYDEWARLARIERGEGSAEDFDAADWSLGARVQSLFDDLGLAANMMDRTIGTLSGGERTRVALARLLMDTPDVILLDEPTNNLDTDGRAAIATLLARWKGGALIASHDRALHNMMDRIIELTPIGCRIFGGGWDAFAAARAADRQRAEATLDRAAREVKTARRDQQEALEKQAKRDRAGKAVAAKGSDPKILLGAQKRRAEATAGRVRSAGDADLTAAQDRQAQAQTAVEIITPIRFVLPPSGLASQHLLVDARGIIGVFGDRHLFGPLDFTIRGPERIALTGPNGSGKTTLLRMLLGDRPPASGTIIADRTRMALLDQHMSMLDSDDGSAQTMLEAMMRLNPGMASHDAYAALAAAGFRGRWAERDTASLSGGERMRLALTCLFARAQPPQLLLLDEPTNHLDIEATELLEAALRDYDGALLCVSHDAAFREAIALTRSISLG